MARQTKLEQLTKSQIQQIRNTASKRVAGLLARLGKCAAGDEGSQMTANQIKAASLVINSVLPAQQSTQVEDITENRQTKADVERAYNEALEALKAKLTTDDIAQSIKAMPDEQRIKLLQSIH